MQRVVMMTETHYAANSHHFIRQDVIILSVSFSHIFFIPSDRYMSIAMLCIIVTRSTFKSTNK